MADIKKKLSILVVRMKLWSFLFMDEMVHWLEQRRG